MLLSLDQYQGSFQHYAPYACIVRNRDIFYFLCQQSKSDPAGYQGHNLVVTWRDNAAKLRASQLQGLSRLSGDMTFQPKEQLICADKTQQIYVLGSGEERLEDTVEVSINGPARGVSKRIKTIGNLPYMVTWRRGICRRTDVNTWESLCPELQLTPDQMPKTPSEDKRLTKRWGFHDVDGFGENDIYAVGGAGDVWHYDGEEWQQCRFPSETNLYNVVCCPTGDVFIAGHGGELYKGREHSWKLINPGGMSLWFNDMVWYEETLFATNDYGVWVLNEHGDWHVPTDLPQAATGAAGSMATRDGVLLVAGVYGAAFKRDGNWFQLFQRYEAENMLAEGKP